MRCDRDGRLFALLSAAVLTFALPVTGQEGRENLSRLSLEELLKVRVTSASRLSEPANLAPATVYVIRADEIEHLGLRDLKDVLALVPGVDAIDPHFFLLGGQRGFAGSFANTLLLVNGREMNNLIAGETFISNQFRNGNVEQIEIINGPGSALYGANALAGVINIITNTARPFEGYKLSAAYGSWESGEASAVVGTQVGRFSIRGAVTHYDSQGDDFSAFLSNPAHASPAAENNPYRRLPSQFGYDNHSAATYVSVNANYAGFFGGVEAYRNASGRGTSGIQWDYKRGSDHRELHLQYAGLAGEAFAKRLRYTAEVRHYWEEFWGDHTEGEGPLRNPVTGATITFGATDSDIETFRGFYSNKRGGGSTRNVGLAQASYVAARHSIVAGTSWESADIVAAAFSRTEGRHPQIGPQQRRPEYSNHKWGLYVQDQLRLGEHLIATIGARYDEHQRYGTSFNPRLGVVVPLSERSTVKFLYGEAFREPNVFEIQNSRGAIRPTSLRTFEAGWNQLAGDLLTNQIVLFHNHADDLLVTDEVALGGISNKGDLGSHGVEDVLRFQRGRWSGFLNYTWTVADLREPARGRHRVYDVPTEKANAGVTYEPEQRYTVSIVARHHGSVRTEYHDAIYAIPAYTAVDVTLSLRRLPIAPNARVQLVVKNLFDTTYYQPEPRAPSVLRHPQDGRDISIRVSIRGR